MDQMLTWKPNIKFKEFDIASFPRELKLPILTSWTRVDAEMKSTGQKRPIVDTEIPVLGSEIVAKTERGEVVGQTIQYGIVRDDDQQFRKSIWVYVQSSGSVFEVSPRLVRPAASEDIQRRDEHIKLAQRVPQAIAKVEQVRKQVREQNVAGSHLIEKMLAVVTTKNLSQKEQTGFFKITGSQKKRVVYIAKKGGRVDLSGFSVEDPGILQVTPEEAQARHIGNVRGQIDFEQEDDVIMNAFSAALDGLS